LLADDKEPMAVYVVWEPVLASDVAPPAPVLVEKLADPRVHRYWDPQLLLSKTMQAAHRDDPKCLLEGDEPVWDAVFLYPPDARWDSAPPRAQFCGRPVIKVIDDLRASLDGEH
jgi:hypothetical protein